MLIKPLISKELIQQRVAQLAQEIQGDHRGDHHLLLVAVLKGAFVFTADLVRCLTMPVEVDFISVSSYVQDRSTGQVTLGQDIKCDVAGKHVIIIEDIVDTGGTIDFLMELFSQRKPASLKVCALLVKPHKMQTKAPISYVGFTLADEFVVGYGLDYDGKYRELPFLGVLDTKGSSRGIG